MFITAYLETKNLGWVLIQTGHLIGPGVNIKKIKYQQKKCQASKFFHKNHKIPSKIYHRNPSLPSDQISAQFYLADHLWFLNEATKSFLVSRELV